MSKKKRKKKHFPAEHGVPDAPRQWFWLPTLLFLAIPLIEILRSTCEVNYVNRALIVHHEMLNWLKYGCWILAGILLILPFARRHITRHLEGLSQMSRAWRFWGPVGASLGFALLVYFVKFCQYRGFQLPEDTANMAQIAHNTLHGRWFESCILAVTNYLGVHFAFTISLFSPVLLVWRSALALIFIQCLAIGSMGLAVYKIIYRLSSSSLAGFIGMLLVYSHPSFHELTSASLDNSLFAPVFFLWAMYFLVSQRWIFVVLFLALAATTRELFPATLAGFGFYMVFRNGRPTRKSLLLGISIMAGSVLLLLGEMKLINSFQSTFTEGNWAYYSHFGSTKEEIISFILKHPLQAFAKTIYPFSRLTAFANLFIFLALLPFAAPIQLLPFWFAALPQMMIKSDTLFLSLKLHYPAFVFGPLLFASAYGVARVYGWLGVRWRGFFLALVLVTSGFGFSRSTRVLLHNWRSDWFNAVPEIIKMIPPDASLWCDQWVSAWVGCRSQLKCIPFSPTQRFDLLLFRPEYVIAEKAWFVHAAPEFRNQVTAFLAENKYMKIADAAHMVLLKDPQSPHKNGQSPDMALPESPKDTRIIQSYIRYVIQGPVFSPGNRES